VVRRELPARATADEVARELRPVLGLPGLLTAQQRRGHPDHYAQHLLHVEDDGSFSVVALVWLPGQSTAIHDHVSWCTVGVYEGRETETRYRLIRVRGRPLLQATGTDVNRRGGVSAVTPPGDIHRVRNSGSSKAISLHIYGADIRALGTSIRHIYD
jgi:predicted metal-dependent enzyme (double-stranded beta helix superfamily)